MRSSAIVAAVVLLALACPVAEATITPVDGDAKRVCVYSAHRVSVLRELVKPGLRWRHVRGSRPVRRRRRVPQRDHQLSCVHSRGPGIGTGDVFQAYGRGPHGGTVRSAQAGKA